MSTRISIGKNFEITKIWDEHFLYDREFDGRHIDISIKGWFASFVIWLCKLD